MNDLTMTILADFGNLLSHLNVFSKHNHSVSCLICGNKEQKNSFVDSSNSFYPIPTSSDLVLLNSGSDCKKRQLIVLNDNPQHIETLFGRELRYHLNFTCAVNLPEKEDEFAILIIIIGPENKDVNMKWTSSLNAKQLIFILPSKLQMDEHFSCLYYHNYVTILKYLIHISMITKQRIRFKDINTYIPLDIGYLKTKQDENQCLFI